MLFESEAQDDHQGVPFLILENPEIEKLVAKRLLVIARSDIPTDTVLQQAAALMALNGSYQLDAENNKAFLVCEECMAHRVRRKRSDNGKLCTTCKQKEGLENFLEA